MTFQDCLPTADVLTGTCLKGLLHFQVGNTAEVCRFRPFRAFKVFTFLVVQCHQRANRDHIFRRAVAFSLSLAYSGSLQIRTMIRTRPNRPIKTKLNILVNTCPQIMCTKVGEILSTGLSDTHLLHLWCPLWVGFKMY